MSIIAQRLIPRLPQSIPSKAPAGDIGRNTNMNEGISLMVSDGTAPDSDALLTWEDLCQRVTLSPRARPSLAQNANPFATAQITSLLSASSYPMHDLYPGPNQYQLETQGPVPLYGGLVLDGPPEDDLTLPEPGTSGFSGTSPSDQSQAPSHTSGSSSSQQLATSSSSQSAKATGEALRKRGRPRKVIDAARGEDPEERRRMQVRMAQRAYRSRKEASISTLKSRIALLETAVEQMSSAVLSFSDEILHSGALESHPDLIRPLRDTVQTCLSLPSRDSDAGSPQSRLALPSPTLAMQRLPSPPTDRTATPPPNPNFFPQKDRTWPVYRSPSSPQSPDAAVMEVPAFIERLHTACLYQAYLVLANPAIPTPRVESKFRMLLNMMPRERVASYFKSALIAKASHTKLEEWTEIPFFSLGGAGTHYPRSRTSSLEPELPELAQTDWYVVKDPLSQFPSGIHDELDGEWFDIKDLEGYLQEKRIRFPALPHEPSKPGPLVHTAANITRLIQSLISGAICLGRTPGFRRRDVEKALEEFRNDYLTTLTV